MALIPLDDPGDPRLADYRGVADPARLRDRGLFVAEGRLVVAALLGAPRFRIRSLLLTPAGHAALRDRLEPRLEGLDAYLAPQSLFEPLTGFNINRGCLAIAERPRLVPISEWLEREGRDRPRTLVAAEGVANPDNLGALFRNALAFGAAALLLGPRCGDPFYRKTVRVSMGAALRVPAVDAVPWPGCLRELAALGCTVVALTTDPAAVPIEAAAEERFERVVVVAGSEGAGLSAEARAAASVAVRIPMAPGVDSLNVATATGIALHRLAARGQRPT